MNKINYLYIIATLLIGVLCGFAPIVLQLLISLVHNLLLVGDFSFVYDPLVHTPVKLHAVLIIIIPALASLFTTYLIVNYAPEAKGHGIPAVIFAIRHRDSYMRPIVAVVKSFASAISIGSGGSSGPEGSIVQICATIGSMQSRYLFHLTDVQKSTLVACGASAGLAATFNAPISGVLFVLEVLLLTTRIDVVVPIMVSTAIAVIAHNMCWSADTFLVVSNLYLSFNAGYIIHYIMLGVISGVGGAVFISALARAKNFFDTWQCSQYIKHAVGMCGLGIVLYCTASYMGHYYVEGVGYATLHDLCNSMFLDYRVVLLLCMLKIIATCLTIGSGASGGVFSPSLFVGACLGSAYYLLVCQSSVNVNQEELLSFVICGMAGMIGATTAAAITAIVMLLEVTHSYGLVMSLMITVPIACLVRKLIVDNSVYAPIV